jgi:hypothetical protein
MMAYSLVKVQLDNLPHVFLHKMAGEGLDNWITPVYPRGSIRPWGYLDFCMTKKEGINRARSTSDEELCSG